MSDSNNRRHVRTKLRADIKVTHPEIGDLSLRTGDISDGGVYILAEGQELPEIGEVVKVQVQGIGGGEAPILEMRIVRIDKDGIGLEFMPND
ncbi:PilZ domain-containing protein [Oceanicoccus sp. KOV_DT_Chl]|uniref:PilZ domain-containing protein n=1 Tax=Oceanicoccus sp. KOV_DT_Chl TaxID=1904639 RepID=UPI001F2C8F2F|nr:PilZ domain-containing protein [Oceanicoccus sp. KOV_DT_Chl]